MSGIFSVSNFSLVYRKTADFCMVIFYPATSWMWLGIFLVKSPGSFMYRITSFENKITLITVASFLFLPFFPPLLFRYCFLKDFKHYVCCTGVARMSILVFFLVLMEMFWILLHLISCWLWARYIFIYYADVYSLYT